MYSSHSSREINDCKSAWNANNTHHICVKLTSDKTSAALKK